MKYEICLLLIALFLTVGTGILFYARDAMAQTVIPSMQQSYILKLSGISANSTISIPAGSAIERIIITNNTGNAILGGLKIGTTNGGIDVSGLVNILGNILNLEIPPAGIGKSFFSWDADQTLYVNALTSWNGTNVDIWFVLRPQFIPGVKP